MERLAKNSIANSPESYDKIFEERSKKSIDIFDLKRWKNLLRYFIGGRLIDLGCLDSLVTVLAKGKYPKSECWGIDLAKQSINHMKNMYPEIIFEVGDVYHTKFPDNYFSYAVAGELMEHLEDSEKFIKEAFRIIKPNGILAVSVPLNEKIEPGAVDKDRHLWSYDLNDFYELFEPYGMVMKYKVIGSNYFPRYHYHFPTLIVWGIKNKNNGLQS